MKHPVYPILIFLFAAAVAACSGGQQPAGPAAEIADVASLMRDWQSLDSASRADSLAEYRPEIEAFMATVSGAPVSDSTLTAWSRSAAVAVFTPAADSVYLSLKPVRQALGHILASASDAGLKLPERRYATVVYGRMEPILFVDSVMLIALNHYLGAGFEGYGGWPVYRRAEKTPERLPYDLAEALVGTQYPYGADGADATLLSRMVYHGALALAKMKLVPEATPAGALGYAPEELKWLEDHENELWQAIVAEKLLYDTSEATASRLINPTPAVRFGGAAYPGRAGRFVGYRVVCAYLRTHPDMPLADMLSPDFYTDPSLLADSGY